MPFQSLVNQVVSAQPKERRLGTTEISDHARERAIEMYLDGRLLREITADTGVSEGSVYRFLQAAGVEKNRKTKRDK